MRSVPDADARAVALVCALCRHTDEHGWHGVEGAAHCSDCHLTWRSKRAAHCPICCEHFTSYSAAILHESPNGCWPPEEVPALKLARDRYSWRRADEHGAAISAPGSADPPDETREVAAEPGAAA
jgi:hypothetical protein